MPVDDPSDLNAGDRTLRKRVERLEAGTGSAGGDSSHAGVGFNSVQLGPDAAATEDRSVAVGDGATSSGVEAIAIGRDATASADAGVAVGLWAAATGLGGVAVGSATAFASASCAVGLNAYAGHARSTAFGYDADTTAADQMMLGTAATTVVVPGTFSNPSARRLKRNIVPAPCLSDIFPELTEWEYIDGDGRRRLGYIADDLVGTDAERFVTVDDDGRPSGIDYLGLLVVQVAQMRAEITALQNELRG
jgi:hypothetical protein